MAKNSLSLGQAGKDKIVKDEANIDGIYNDQSNFCTFGIGHLVHPIEKYECFLLKAASSDDVWKAYVKKKWEGTKDELPYLKRATTGAKDYATLEAKAVEVAKEAIAKKKHNNEFGKLTDTEQKSVTESANAAVKEQSRLLAQEVESVFNADKNPAETAVNNAVTVELNQDEFDALFSFAFNTDKSGIKFKGSSLLKKINEGKFRTGDAKGRKESIDAIEQQFLAWNTSNGAVLPDLTQRRKDEATKFLKRAREELAKVEQEEEKAKKK